MYANEMNSLEAKHYCDTQKTGFMILIKAVSAFI